MREKRYRGDVRHQSPPRSRARHREYSPRRREIGDRPFDQSLGSAADESERSRRMDSGSGSAARRVYDSHYDDGDRDRDRDVQSRRLSEFNEGLSRGDSTAMKFQWKHLLAEPAKLSVESTDVDYSLNRSIDGSIDGTDRNYQEIRYSDTNQKNYQDIRYSDTNRTGMLFEKPFSVEADRGRSYSFYSPDHVGVSRSSGHLDDGFSLPSLNLNLGLRKNEPFDSRIQTRLDKLLVDKSPAWELYKEERNSMVYSKDPLDYKLLPFSGSKAIGTDSKEDIPAPLKGYGLSPEMNSRPLGHDGYRRVSRTKSPVELSDRRNYHRAYRSPTEEKHGDCTYLDGQRSVRGHMGTTSEEFHGNMLTIGEKYGHRDSLRTSIVDPIVDRIEECSHREQLRELRLSDHIPSSQGQESPDYLEVCRSLHVTKQEREVLYFGNTHREYKRQDHGSLLSGEGHGYESGGDPWTREDSCEMLPMAEYDPYLDVMDGSSKRRSTDRECSFHESSRTILKRKRAMDEKSSMLKFGSKTSSTGKSARRFHDHGVADERRTGEDRKPLFLSNKSRFSHSKYGKTGSASNETASHGTPKSDHWSSSVNVSVSIPRHVSKPHSSRGRDIKKRLGPGPQNTHVSHPLGKNDKSLLKKRMGPQPQSIHVSHSSVKNGEAFVKKRLGPGPQKFRVSLPWLKNYQHRKFPRKIQGDGSDGGLNDEGGDGDPLEGKLTIEKAEPPERSEDFKQLVHHAFFRFVRHLNENSGQRRRYMEQGKAGTLKCSICGSDSEEFLDTESLAMHAFSSPKVGCRSQHLGFHKALCVLMGWKTELGPGSPWVREILSDAETLAVKDDLIIWPPVVVVHNSSIVNKNPDERVIVSIELLESILKDMGFGEKTKVCRGKAANHSIMVVKFNATFSGFQEAERLHSFYAETKHGRAEFQHLDSTGEAPADKVEHVLYGHLGLAADLDKLDFETKKRCLVKSKREIQNIADAPLKTG